MWVVVAAVAVLVGAGVFVAVSGGDDDSAAPSGAAGEVFLEAASAPGRDPFTDSVDTNRAGSMPLPVVPASLPLTTTTRPGTTTSLPASTTTTAAGTTAATTTTPGATAVTGVQGYAPGLYGGTRDNGSCDVEQMVAFLTANPAKAQAWADVQGIAVADLPSYLRSLTPVVLRTDTRVTNHGYANGRATPRQSVLQAGTAVLIDAHGIPRVKCGCGNPLLPPIPQATGVRYVDPPWPGFEPAATVVIVNTVNVQVNTFVVVDLSGGGYFVRKAGPVVPGVSDGTILIDTLCDLYPEQCNPPALQPPESAVTTRAGEPELKTGDVQVSLRWDSTADLDLAVTDPAGRTVNFDNPVIAGGGTLDVDANSDCENVTSTPVENVFWPPGQSPDGQYVVTVSYYRSCGGGTGPQAFELTILVGGTVVTAAMPAVVRMGGRWSMAIPAQSLRDTLNAEGDTKSIQFRKDPIPPARQLPGQVQGLSATPGPGSVTLAWQPPAGAAPVKSYRITVVPGATILTTTATSFTVPGLEPGTTYQFNVEALNDNGGGPAAAASATPAATPPPGTTATTVPGGSNPNAPQPGETLEQYCTRLYPPAPGPNQAAENPMWTLCMHDPRTDPAPDPSALPQNVP